MKVNVSGLRVFAMHMMVLAGFSLMQGCTTGDAPVRWLNWPYSTPKDAPVVLPAGPDITDVGLLPMNSSMPAVESAIPSAKVHTVQKGETLSSIASSYGTSWKALADYNALSNPNVLKVGQEIKIPDAYGTVTPVKKPAPVSCRPVPAPIKQGTTYTIQKGDYLSSIAKRSGLTVNEIKLANGLKSDSIIAGKKLSIPKKGEVKAVAAAKPIPAKAANPAQPVATSSMLPAPAPIVDAAPAVEAAPAAAPVAVSASAPVYEHVLYPGETLDDVARQYGSSQQEIMKLNNITDPASVKPGTKLLVPIPE
ncbi:MAG: LysM peptidoglycan-binding domain-containing protein [Kiritimatiellales bacterium]|nr:LysM peptidoglycan-binding domain-containing protein [Kiritimatiellales bacterium]